MKMIKTAMLAAGLAAALLPATAEGGALKRMTAGGSNVFGYLCYSDNDSDLQGLYSLEQGGYSLMWQDPLIERAAELYTGWVRDGILYGVALQVDGGGRTSAYNVQQDLYTGEVYEIKAVGSKGSYFTVATLNQSDGNVYGVASTPEGGWAFSSAPSGAPEVVMPICEADKTHDFCSLTYNVEDGKMYGVNRNMEFVTIATDGTVTVLSPVKVAKTPLDYQTGLIYSSQEHLFYWNVNFTDYTSALYTISPDGKNFELVESYKYCEEFAFFVSPDGKVDPALPAAPVYKSSSFPEGSLSGTVTFTLPTATEGGEPISGQLSWKALLDNVEYKSGSGAPGADVTLDFTDLEQGRHTFMLTAIYDGKESMRGRISLFIGPDRPLTPANVALAEDGTLTWSAVSQGVAGGYIDVDALVYRIYDIDGKMVDSTDGTTWKATLPTDKPLTAYRFGVAAAYGADNISDTGWSQYRVVGQPLTMPVSLDPEPRQALLFTIDDVNGDGRGWRYDDGYEFSKPAEFKCEYGNVDSDDWLFLPAINFAEASKVYEVTFKARSLSIYDNESFRVYVGDEPNPESMTEAITDRITPPSSYAEVKGFIVPEKAGVKYIGIHGTSAAMQAGVGVREFVVKESSTSSSTPGVPTGIEARGGENGKLEVLVDFTMPVKDIAGRNLAADTELTASLLNETTGELVETKGKQGQKMSMKMDALQGVNNMTLSVVSKEGTSIPTEFSVYVGVVVPVGVTGVKCDNASDMMSATISWQPVTTGVGDGYIDPSKITYNIYLFRQSPLGSYWEPLLSGVKEASYTYTAPKGAAQEYLTFGVRAANEAGESAGIGYVATVIGTPYDLPIEENFAGMYSPDDFALEPYVISQPTAAYTGEWDCVRPEQISSQIASQEGYYFIAYGSPGSKARIGIPRFTTDKGNAVVMLNSMSCHGVAQFSVYAECEGVPVKLIGKVPLDATPLPHEATFPLPEEFAFKPWVQVYFDCTLTEDERLGCIRSFKVTGAGSAEGVAVDEATVTVVDLAGRVILRNADPSRLATLDHGIYIVNGRKVRI